VLYKAAFDERGQYQLAAVAAWVLGEYGDVVGRCRLTVSSPVLKAPMVSALEATI